MTSDQEIPPLSSDELDAVNGGTTISGCTKSGSVNFFGVRITAFSCSDGTMAYEVSGPRIK